MSDTRELVFPMTAGDVVRSVQIVSIVMRGDGPAIDLLEVMDVQHLQTGLARMVVRSGEHGTAQSLDLDPDTPLLLTGIRRR